MKDSCHLHQRFAPSSELARRRSSSRTITVGLGDYNLDIAVERVIKEPLLNGAVDDHDSADRAGRDGVRLVELLGLDRLVAVRAKAGLMGYNTSGW